MRPAVSPAGFPGLLLLALTGAFLAAPPLAAQFTDKAAAAGVDLDYPTSALGHLNSNLDPYSVGGASCAVDLDGDGWTDLIVARTGKPCLVFINNRDGTFREEARARGLDTVSDIGGLAAGDLHNRGVPDIVMSPISGARCFLFVNDGTGRFREAAAERGVDLPVTIDPHKGQSISLVDYDRDGYLDIHFYEWNVPHSAENAQHSALLRNRGRAAPGHFENRTAASGLTQPRNAPVSAGYCGLWADLDGDGYQDLMLSADFGYSQMWWNNGDGTFTESTVASGLSNTADAMGVALLDYNGDGQLDLFVTTIGLTTPGPTQGFVSSNKLFRALGPRRYAESAAAAGVTSSGWGWGTAALDANNDGLPDLAITNGYSTDTTQFEAAKTDYSKLYLNRGDGTFTDASDHYHITDNLLGRGLAVLDYDNDGRQDIFITNTIGHRLLYHNDTPAAGTHWLGLKFTGTTSNRDGYGAEVTLTAGGRTQIAVYNPTNSYLAQHQPRLHFGLGSAATATRLSIKWPSGTVQILDNVPADQLLSVVEPGAVAGPPTLVSDLRDAVAFKDDRVTLSVLGSGTPAPVYIWFKNGTRLDGQSGTSLTFERIQPGDAGHYTVQILNQYGTVTTRTATLSVTQDLTTKSTAHWWNEALLDGIRKDTPNPPVHARNLFHLSAAFWDTYWAYERGGWDTRRPVYTQETPALPADESARAAAQQQAMSYAAYTFIQQRFAHSPGRTDTYAGIRWLMQLHGYDPDFSDAAGSSPAATGIRIGRAVLAATLHDGANEAGGYADATGFIALNQKLTVRDPGTGPLNNPDYWQPLDLVNTITQNGIVLGPSVQTFVGVNAINTRPFALRRQANRYPVDDPGAPPRFAVNKAEYIRQAREVIEYSAQLGTADGITLDISPGKLLHNPLGTNDGTGRAVNPATGQPYAANVVLRGDYARLLAEFWADGPQSETPPGHWNVLFNEISDHPKTTRQLLGLGPPLPRLQWDVCGYLALNGALHDAACAAWSIKWQYNSARPITMIRHLASLGQSSDATQPAYHADGLPLVNGLIELVTSATAAAGQKHAGLTPGKLALKVWPGNPADPTQVAGVVWVQADTWVPYQLNTFVTPAFPAYISGHSTFSRAAAESLSRLLGTDYFPGGMATYDFAANGFLKFEAGPSKALQLQWATFFDAADQAGLSRLYGGIHIAADDFAGRRMGAKIGDDAFELFLRHHNTANGTLPVFTAHPASASVTAGQNATFRVAATSNGSITHRWQRMPAGSNTWADLADTGGYSGATTAELAVSSATTAQNGDLFRAVLTTSGGITTSHVASLAVTAASTGTGGGGGGSSGGPAGGGSSGGGGGGGAPSAGFVAALLLLWGARYQVRRK